MTSKQKILEIMEQKRDDYISGQYIAKKLEVSRAAVWKNINLLKEDGYKIESKTNKGYRLVKDNDILSEVGIKNSLKDEYKNTKILVLDRVDSTNNYAKKYAVDTKENLIVLANEQTAGRGRRGRSFASPEKGIYMSMVLRPQIDLKEVYFSTILTVVAVHRALSKFTDERILVKWVNDLYIGKRKICGILTELVSNLETMDVEFLVLGIGINVNSDIKDYPDELSEKVGIFKSKGLNRNQLIAHIANEVFALFKNYDKALILEEYKSLQLLFGKMINFEQNGLSKTALAVDITENGELVVMEKGEKIILNSGDVSVKLGE